MRTSTFLFWMLLAFVTFAAIPLGTSEPSTMNKNMSAINSMPAVNTTAQENLTERANLMIVKQSYDAYMKGNISALLANYTNDSVWIEPGGPEVPLAGIYHGKAQIAGFFKTLASVADMTQFNVREYIAKGNEVVVIGSYQGRVKSTGKIFSSDWVDIVTLNKGIITKYQTYQDTASLVSAFAPSNASQNVSAINRTALKT